MLDARTVAGLLLLLGPVLGAIPIANPSLMRLPTVLLGAAVLAGWT
jgi:hypothetical protein